MTVALSGNFTFAESAAFRAIIDEVATSGPTAVAIDMSGLRMVDSAALSMLMQMRDRLTPTGASITLLHPSPLVDRVLSVVDFGRLFTIVR
ncbi:MAG TPA: STAS domain-containing protein [Azospirillum sp.]